MRIKVTAQTRHPAFFPFNYQYILQAALYDMIRKSSSAHAAFLHERGYVRAGIGKPFKFFTFSKLGFTPHRIGKGGFQKVRQVEFIFATCTEKSFRHLILGMFSKGEMKFSLAGQKIILTILNVTVLEDPKLSGKETFTCLSPIAVSTKTENRRGQAVPHFLNYMVPSEREHFIVNLKKNLVNKFETMNDAPYEDHLGYPFEFQFDPNYIARKNGRISKLIEFKNGIKIKAMEAPFTVEADPELIKTGYECGWGEKNSAGFGCVKSIRT